MDMYALTQGSFWQTKEPASVFDETGFGIEALLISLGRKIQALANVTGDKKARERFGSWLNENRSDIFALVFHAGETVSDETDRISMHVITDFGQTKNITESIIKAGVDIFNCSVSDYLTMVDVCTETGGSRWRAFFSSELLIAGHDHQEVQMLKMHFLSVRDIFEDGNVLKDVGMLISEDVYEKIMDKGYSRGSQSKSATIEICDNELTSLAIKAMERRRVNPVVHQKVLPVVKKIFSGLDSCPGSKSY